MFTTITTPEREQCGVSRLPDAPTVTAAELKQDFDSLGNLAIDKFIQHIDEISADTAADNIGAAVPDGLAVAPRVQPMLDAFYEFIKALQTDSHTHENKDVLDDILNVIYPVGSIYSTTSDSFNPSTAFGGTWEAYTWTGDTSGLYHFVKTA